MGCGTRVRVVVAFALIALLGAGCTGVPAGLTPVQGFDVERYLGTWYEIARLDHRFERGLEEVTATYRRRNDGGITVVNRGYAPDAGEWREVRGKAYFLGSPEVASLRVSFFGPFYGGYHVIALDHAEYRYAMVSGPSRDYLWILARGPRLPAPVTDRLVTKARELGFATDGLIFPRHKEAQAGH